MPKRKGSSKLDLRNLVIVLLLFFVGIETYVLYQHKLIAWPKSAARTTKPKPSPVPITVTRIRITPAPSESPGPAVSPAAELPAGRGARIAIILDDWGYNAHTCVYLKEISVPLTVSVLPDLPYSQDVMTCASENHKELMLHLPMEPHENADSYPADYVLKTSMSQDKVEAIVDRFLKDMPLVAGVNNHMGSKATEDRRLMKIVFDKLRHKGLFFVDSRVTAKSVCPTLAREMKIPFTGRDVFLDNTNEAGYIRSQIEVLARKARSRGYALGIGHDRELTLKVLKDMLPVLKSQGYEIITVREYIKRQ